MTRWFKDVWEGFWTVLVGMRITWRHMFTQSATLQYPTVKWPLPPKSRMRLFMKYEDCIGCGQCARACPVQCIYIKTEKRPADKPPAWASTGQPIKLDVKVFDIDMSLCCYCNLCTYPCPTVCIYMTTDYEFAATDLTQHLYRFAKPDARLLTEDPKKKAAPPDAAPAAGGSGPTAAAAPAAGGSGPTAAAAPAAGGSGPTAAAAPAAGGSGPTAAATPAAGGPAPDPDAPDASGSADPAPQAPPAKPAGE